MDFDAATDGGTLPQSLVRELELNESRYRALFGHNPDPVFVVDADGLIVSGNQALEALTGYPLNELLLRSFIDFVVEADREHALRHVRRALSGTAQILEFTGVNRDAREFTVSASVFPFREEGQVIGIYGIARDITAHKEGERLLRDSEERYRMLADHVQDMISLHDLEGRFMYATPSASNLLGVHPVELIGKSVYEMVLPEDVGSLQAAHRDILGREGKGPLAYRARRGDGSVGWFETSARVTEPDSVGERRIVSVTRDISERRKLEQRLTQSEKLEAIGRLAGGIAHDFNNLLTVISGQAQMALADLPPHAPMAEELDAICEAADRATALTAQLLTLGKRQMTRPTALNVNESVLGLHSLMRRLVTEDVEIATDLATELWQVRIDPAQLEQVVINLIVNARDAMRQGGRISLSTSNVDAVTAHAEAIELQRTDYVRLRVQDTGSGMDDETVRRAFEPFFSSKPNDRGTGLGLSTVYGIVQQAGGVVLLHSMPGAGTTVSVYLRRSADRAAPAVVPAGAPDASSMHGTELVLIAEDDNGVRSFAQAVLERYGYNVEVTASGAEAIEKFKALEHVDMLLTDVIMPNMPGTELAEQLRAFQPSLPVLFISGYAEDALARKGLTGTVDLLTKPFRPDSLAAQVRSLLDRAAAEAAEAAPA